MTTEDERKIRVRKATREDIPGIVWVSNTSIPPNEDVGFGGGLGSPFHDPTQLTSSWKEPNTVGGQEVLVAEVDGRVVGCVTLEDRGSTLELVNIDVPMELQGEESVPD